MRRRVPRGWSEPGDWARPVAFARPPSARRGGTGAHAARPPRRRRAGGAEARSAAALDEYAQQGRDGLVFVGVRGGQLRRSNFSKPWARALEAAGLEAGEVHVHDLRHTGNTYAAESGASLAEMMNRMGHSSSRAAQIYLHARRERDREIASTVDKMAKRELKKAKKARKKPDGSGDGSGT